MDSIKSIPKDIQSIRDNIVALLAYLKFKIKTNSSLDEKKIKNISDIIDSTIEAVNEWKKSIKVDAPAYTKRMYTNMITGLFTIENLNEGSIDSIFNLMIFSVDAELSAFVISSLVLDDTIPEKNNLIHLIKADLDKRVSDIISN